MRQMSIDSKTNEKDRRAKEGIMAIEIYTGDYLPQCPYAKIDQQAQRKPLSNDEVLKIIDNQFKTVVHPNCRCSPILILSDLPTAPEGE